MFCSTEKKILRLSSLEKKCADARAAGKTIVSTNGCFDLLHYGHVQSLEEARGLGDILVVGVNSDSSVKSLKGDSRPIVSDSKRARMLASLEAVTYVSVFEDLTPIEFLKIVQPSIHCKGEDYDNGQVLPEEAVVTLYGGEIHYLKLAEGFSTTEIISRVRND